jgi:glutamate formiminotransferase
MQLSDILIERIDCFFNFHEDNENEISHLEKTIYNHQNVAIRDSHEDAENQRTHIIHEDIASSAFERRKRAQSILITLTR